MDHASGAIDAFLRSRASRPHWHPVAAEFRPRDMGEGYRLQHRLHAALALQGVNLVGYKIGCTSTAGQRSFGLDEPVYAGIFDTTRATTLREALAIPLIAPMVECEIAFVMGVCLDGGSDLSDEALAAAVATAHVACEVVDARYGVPPADIGAPTLLADDFLHARFVLGPPMPEWRALPLGALSGAIEIDDATYAGSTAEVLSPFEALGWLVRKLTANGERLEAGATVLTGSLVVPTPIHLPARHVAIAVEGFGRLTLAD
ncbi:2-keto-4-pentenoate hydratase [Ancylobacter aquaticus]|uniref:2-keto-4-pentenoate hydratase n=1 Tax=Ancylobacter aquaticus TaxID=100 RepID=A0A4R1I0U9_ANCAQ|nr:hydratase [Ancylobacter aquaticus]TCK28338.1 2-keto-4-pentenoate hydratase [Ancylobacter aquaticus]